MAKTKRPEAYSAIRKKVGERIAWARELVPLSQTELAVAMGHDASTINKIEQGTRPPNMFQVIEIATRCRVSTDYLLRGALTNVLFDEEMQVKLAALHPELVGRPSGTDRDTGMVLVSNTLRSPRRPALEG